ncbi:MAG: hypothetical protein AB7T06_04090 [Kofleriaceae bacterium]
MQRDSLVAEATAIELRVDQSWHPDDLAFLPADYQGPELVAVAHANRIVSLTPYGRIVRPLSSRAASTLLDAVTLARSEQQEPGIDTALSRLITTFRIRVDHARGPSHSFSLIGAVNHMAPHALPGLWSTFLRVLRDAIGPLDAETAAAWDLALTWTGPFELGPTFKNGGVVALPHLVTALTIEDALYLRTGQLPVAGDPYRTMDRTPSVLYHLDVRTGVLFDQDAKRSVEPEEVRGTQQWTLPCGGGAIALHREWKTPPRIVVRVDDPARGIYVQKV